MYLVEFYIHERDGSVPHYNYISTHNPRQNMESDSANNISMFSLTILFLYQSRGHNCIYIWVKESSIVDTLNVVGEFYLALHSLICIFHILCVYDVLIKDK